MDKFQAAFEILYFLSAIDGKVAQSEVEVIYNFLQANYESVSFDPWEIVDSVECLTLQGKFEEMNTVVRVFKNSSSAQDLISFMDFAIQLIASDGNISDEESQLLQILANEWNVDLSKFLRRRKDAFPKRQSTAGNTSDKLTQKSVERTSANGFPWE